MQNIRQLCERHQAGIYFSASMLAMLAAFILPGTSALEAGINPALGFMLFVTFLQVPLIELGRAFTRGRFLAAVLTVNFVVIPLLVAALVPLFPAEPLMRLGMLLVLLTPCIDYVITFSHMGRADTRLLLAATPTLLVVQMLMLPVYLGLILGDDAATLVETGPFIHAFAWLIAVPLILASLVQLCASHIRPAQRVLETLGIMPVPATALVLFIVIAAVLPQLGASANAAVGVIPFYIAFAILAPLIGWAISRLFRLDAPAGRAVAFSAGTRNSLVILPLALAVPGAIPILPAVVLTQTFIELISQPIYVRVIARFGGPDPAVNESSL